MIVGPQYQQEATRSRQSSLRLQKRNTCFLICKHLMQRSPASGIKQLLLSVMGDCPISMLSTHSCENKNTPTPSSLISPSFIFTSYYRPKQNNYKSITNKSNPVTYLGLQIGLEPHVVGRPILKVLSTYFRPSIPKLAQQIMPKQQEQLPHLLIVINN